MYALSNKSKYALQALAALARHYRRGPMLIADLAEQERIPKKFLEMILLELKNKGLLHSKKGKGGGYALALSPERVTVGEVVRILDGPLAPVPCVSQLAYRRCEECGDEETCGIRAVMQDVRDAIAAILDRETLANLVRRTDALNQERKKVIVYAI